MNHNNQLSFGHDDFVTEDILMLSLHWPACKGVNFSNFGDADFLGSQGVRDREATS